MSIVSLWCVTTHKTVALPLSYAGVENKAREDGLEPSSIGYIDPQVFVSCGMDFVFISMRCPV
jgi:hypothetical protein